MTEVSKMTDQQLNRALAELMGYSVERRYWCGNPEMGHYALLNPDGEVCASGASEHGAWNQTPNYEGDPAASLEVQAAAIAKHKGWYFRHLLTLKNVDLQASPVVAYEAIALATCRQRAEAAYMTLKGEEENG